ncbi:linker for activation of T-cells family member 2 [Puma concolor]|uniref:Linker for activation of T-cells family member 2 n=1 Tax=Puma concolor TaxID=9696 RepID=A0A6P6HSY0_PUMCO|nr:linker for activation of T-cells family member 2 [Puma concolor]
MNVDAELLWPGVALLLLLGTVASLCVRCSRPVVKKSEKIYEQRSLGAETGGSHEPAFLPDSASSRYLENFSKGSRRGSDGAFIDPIATHYYNWGQFQKPLEDDDDANSYENVLICKRKDTESERGPREASPSLAGSPDEEPDYVNESVAATEA